MGQQRDPSSESPAPEAVDEEVGGEDGSEQGDFTERYFWVLLGTMILLASGTGVGVVYTQYSRVDQAVKSVPYADRIARAVEAVPYVGGADTTGTKGGDAPTFGSFTELKRLIVNPAESGGSRYLAVSVAFETNSSSVAKELKNKKVVVRDAALRLLSKRTAEELSDPGQRDDLKKALRKETNSILRSGTVDRLYFTEFVLQ